jgi:hypothetical protein
MAPIARLDKYCAEDYACCKDVYTVKRSSEYRGQRLMYMYVLVQDTPAS